MKKILISVLAVTVLGLWFFSAPLLAGNTSDPWKRFPDLTEGRYLYIRDFPAFVSALEKNTTMKTILDSETGKDILFSPPLESLRQLSQAVRILPETFRLTAFSLLIPEDLYYAGGSEGWVLFFRVSPAGKTMLSNVPSEIPHTIQGDWFYLSSHGHLLEQQLRLSADNAGNKVSPYEPQKGLAYLTVEPRHGEQKSPLKAFYSLLFPETRVQDNTFVFTPGEEGITIESKAAWKAQNQAADFLSQTPPIPPVLTSAAPVVFFTPLGADQWKEWVSGEDFSARDIPMKAELFSIAEDSGIMLPELVFTAGAKAQTAFRLLSQSLQYGSTEAAGSGDTASIRYVSYSWRNQTEYYLFHPQVEISESTVRFSTTQNARELSQKQPRRIALRGQKDARTILAVSAETGKFVSASLPSLTSVSALYYPQAYADFTDTLKALEKMLANASLEGSITGNKDWVQSHFYLHL